MMASRWSSIRGSGTLSHRISVVPCQTSAFIAISAAYSGFCLLNTSRTPSFHDIFGITMWVRPRCYAVARSGVFCFVLLGFEVDHRGRKFGQRLIGCLLL